MDDRLPVRDALLSFAARQPLRAALFLTYSFDGRWFEEALVPDLCERPIETMLVVRDGNALTSEAPSVRYRKANARRSAVFHPKLALLVSEDRVRAIIGSANLTRAGFERQRELGRVYDLGPESAGEHGMMTALLEYLKDGVANELKGESLRTLGEVTGALREVVERYAPTESGSAHTLLHNYVQPIWPQMLARLPHRVLRRAIVVSPFFEPDRQKPDDPALAPGDSSIFARLLFEDFQFETPEKEKPLHVYFRLDQGRTELPVQKLGEHKDRIAFFAQDERDRRLHAKLLLLEGAAGPGRPPFLVALHGSPNFTTAGLLREPPHGNSELAVLTVLPTKSKALRGTMAVLALGADFQEVEHLGSVRHEERGVPPSPPGQGLADTTFHVADGTLHVALAEAAPPGTRIRVHLWRDGAWIAIGEADVPGGDEVVVPVTGLAERDSRTELLELRGVTVRIELIASDGAILMCDTGPVNVDVPQEFCGLTRTGTAILSLDERIARAGIGVLPTYREQQRWLEKRREPNSGTGSRPITAHQADLDRFYRNLHRGLRGIQARCKASPGSEFTLRRSLDDLTLWGVEGISESTTLSRECKLFLIDRLLRMIRIVIEGTPAGLRPRLPVLTRELGIPERLEQIDLWLQSMEGSTVHSYVAGCRCQMPALLESLNQRTRAAAK